MNDLIARVKEDIRCHRENGVDLNPYSTPGMRRSWQNGFEGKPEVLLDYSNAYQRGRMAALLERKLNDRDRDDIETEIINHMKK